MPKNKHIYNLEITEALQAVDSSRDGLSTVEAKRRQAKYGPNAIATKKKPFFKRLLEPFASAFVGVLLVAIVLTIIEKEYVDATILSITVGVNAIIYYAQQYSVSRVLKTLQKKDVSYVHALRDGQTTRVQSETLTVGDIVYVEEGMKVPADGRLIDANQIQADEALLTGESLPVHKQAAAINGEPKVYDQRNMLFHGTYIKGGSGQMVVTAIGNQTELGGITALAAQADLTRSPIERKIDSLTKKLIVAVVIIGLLALTLEIWRGFAIEEAIRFALVIVVSAVPEGLPVALTIVLLLSARRMAKVRALVKKISSIETMGAVTLIATDKTGTITQNKLSVADKHSTHDSRRIFDQIVRSSLNMEGDHASDPLDKILLDSVKNTESSKTWQKVKNYPFNQALRISGVAWKHNDGYSIYIKGAPEHVLEYCREHHRKDEAVMNALERFTSRGHRTIAFAHKDMKELPDKLTHHSLAGMDFDGFVGMADKLRPKVAEAVREARRAGVEVIMLTGDHIKTAGYIARQVGIVAADGQVSDSRVLEAGDPEAIRASLSQTRAFGRVLPEHKYALLKATKGHEITAMTGDGVNDIPALVEADAGISMGSGTDAAKDASDIVLLDSNFHTIVRAIRVGRTALANIRKMLVYLLGTSSGEVLTIISALVLGIPLPVAAIQILWINLVTDGVSVIPLGLSPSESRQMNQPPRAPNASLLNIRQVTRIILIAVVMSMTVLWIFTSNLDKGHLYAQTLAFLGLVVAQWANAFNVNLEYKSWIYNFKRPNWKLVVAIGFSIILMVIMFVTPLGQFLNLVDVGWRDAIIAIVVPVVAVLLAVDLHKLIFYLGAKIRKKPLV
jgi:P-type Ca2+ transporter type 2C